VRFGLNGWRKTDALRARRGEHHTGSVAPVRIHIHELAQLYNSLDPSPFWDRDLDRNAAEFIEGEFRERLWADTWHLIVHVRSGDADSQTLQSALESYYDRLTASTRRELKEHFRSARLGLLAGLTLFGMFMGARTLLRATVPALPSAVDEGLIILAWLTLWRPAETLAYEWLPLYRRQRLYERLRSVRVSVQLDRHVTGTDKLPTPSEAVRQT
jgi:hypothetical protein